MVPVISPYFFSNHWFSALEFFELPNNNSDIQNQYLVKILDAWNADDRYYHNLEHLADMLIKIDENIDNAQQKAIYVLAAFFHDYIYIPENKDNEEVSANMAESVLKLLHLPEADIDAIKKIILATRHSSDSSGFSALESAFIDIDLSILAAEPDKYQEYIQKIRKEYIHIPDHLFKMGRKAFLESMLLRDTFFISAIFADTDMETKARNNISTELKNIMI